MNEIWCCCEGGIDKAHDRAMHCKSKHATHGVKRGSTWLPLCRPCGTAYLHLGYRVKLLPTGYDPKATCESAASLA